MRTLIDRDPYSDRPENAIWFTRGRWPCAWIDCPHVETPPIVTAYRRRFVLDDAVTLRVHVTADERYELFLDPLSASGFTLASTDAHVRQFWIEHCITCRHIGAHFGREAYETRELSTRVKRRTP